MEKLKQQVHKKANDLNFVNTRAVDRDQAEQATRAINELNTCNVNYEISFSTYDHEFMLMIEGWNKPVTPQEFLNQIGYNDIQDLQNRIHEEFPIFEGVEGYHGT